jgi:4-hydroxy-3-polyprenylbenzoate decarboxylase
MPFASLRDFLRDLESRGELVRVREPVSTVLEMTEIQTRLLAEGGPAVIFENPVRADGQRSALPVAVNLFGTVARVAAAIGRKPEELRGVGETLAFLRQPEPPGGWREAVEMLPLLKTVLAMKPKVVGHAPCQDVVWTGADIDLGALPIQTCWPGEPAPLITWPLVVTEDIDGRANLGIYRMQVIGRDRTLMRWLAHRGGALHFRRWQEAHPGQPMPACAVIGADPATVVAAVTPVPETLSEYQFAGLLRGRKVELVAARTQSLKVPAEAEIVIEGQVLAGESGDEGPYGDHTGYYNAVEQLPGLPGHRHHDAARPDLSFDLHRPAARRAFGAGRGAERGVHSAHPPAVPRDR